jgi:hypothetical protein
MSSVYDVLLERFVHDEGAEWDALPGSERTLRNYIGWLRETGQVAEPERSRRLYDHVDDPPAGRQLQLDFGQAKCDGGLTVHFLCMLLRMSRYLGVCAQDHRFDSEEACAAIYRFMCKIGGGRRSWSSTRTASSSGPRPTARCSPPRRSTRS